MSSAKLVASSTASNYSTGSWGQEKSSVSQQTAMSKPKPPRRLRPNEIDSGRQFWKDFVLRDDHYDDDDDSTDAENNTETGNLKADRSLRNARK
ncbi:Hypothetical protein NTJ_15403 [Nesidiocoris tenuis]|uniref:Uncharacterized protein n=1 Tax=Nesidiocoris tenuis TaxID=355587 RepID=A0ABN7BDX4_9HEMI|nr:Hypothetical protein NTJ_15403 [Nesidiocoris tenuis]